MAVSNNNIKWLLFLLIIIFFAAGIRTVEAQDSTDDEDGPDMVSISATTFEMGEAADVMLAECNLFRTGCEISWFGASQPAHTVELDPFSIDRFEVTNESFLEFINGLDSVEGACDGEVCFSQDDSAIELDEEQYVVDEALLDHPVAGVSWFGANAFCEWRDARLPTEAEWELSAGWDFEEGTKHFYPWGDEFDGDVVNFCDSNCSEQQADADYDDGYEMTAPVGSYEDGRSSAGLYDMAGNLWEWVSDWYDPAYYGESPASNPTGPTTGDNKVVRGGSWFDTGNFTTAAVRFPAPPTESGDSIGFRCASDAVNEDEMIGQVAEVGAEEAAATEEPEAEETVQATATATRRATATPSPTVEPTEEPAATATAMPTATPTEEPTAAPTATATKAPTKVPTPTATATAAPTEAPTEEATASATATVEPTEEPTAEAAVETTEDTSAIAPVSFNCALYPGENLGSTYIVGACDGLLKIARTLGVDYTALRAANPQVRNPNLIYIGQILNVPEAGAQPVVIQPAASPSAVPSAPAAAPAPTGVPSPTPIPATPSGSSLNP